MPIPALIAYHNTWVLEGPSFLDGMLSASGYIGIKHMVSCLDEVPADELYTGEETPDPFHPPLCVIVISRIGNGEGDESGIPPDMAMDLEGFENLLHFPRRFLFLVDEKIEIDLSECSAHPNALDVEVLTFHHSYVEGATTKLSKYLVDTASHFRSEAFIYQTPELLRKSLDIDLVNQVSYVWPTGFGIIETSFVISHETLHEKESYFTDERDRDQFSFPHEIAIRVPPDAMIEDFQGKTLKKFEARDLASIFDQENNLQFAVVRFGKDCPPISWREEPISEVLLKPGEDLVRKLWISVDKKSVEEHGVLKYGFIWSRSNLFIINSDISAYTLRHTVTSLHQSVRFMRSLDSNLWDFGWGPRLLRHGPYDNDFGYVDMEGLPSAETFHYFDFAWESNRVARGSSQSVVWKLRDSA